MSYNVITSLEYSVVNVVTSKLIIYFIIHNIYLLIGKTQNYDLY